GGDGARCRCSAALDFPPHFEVIMRSLFGPFALAVGLSLLHSATAHAQRWGSDYIDQVYNAAPNTYFYDSAPFTHKYNYNPGGILYFNGNSRPLAYADYLDR